jgi:hypothetical protein
MVSAIFMDEHAIVLKRCPGVDGLQGSIITHA